MLKKCLPILEVKERDFENLFGGSSKGVQLLGRPSFFTECAA